MTSYLDQTRDAADAYNTHGYFETESASVASCTVLVLVWYIQFNVELK